MSFHHFGLAVKSPREAVSFLSALGYRISEPVFDPYQNVHLMMGTHATEPQVEIIYPGKEGSPIDEMIKHHGHGIIYHLCYVTQDLDATLKQLKASGIRLICVSKPQPALLFQGRHVSFYHLTGMGLIEILE